MFLSSFECDCFLPGHIPPFNSGAKHACSVGNSFLGQSFPTFQCINPGVVALIKLQSVFFLIKLYKLMRGWPTAQSGDDLVLSLLRGGRMTVIPCFKRRRKRMWNLIKSDLLEYLGLENTCCSSFTFIVVERVSYMSTWGKLSFP